MQQLNKAPCHKKRWQQGIVFARLNFFPPYATMPLVEWRPASLSVWSRWPLRLCTSLWFMSCSHRSSWSTAPSPSSRPLSVCPTRVFWGCLLSSLHPSLSACLTLSPSVCPPASAVWGILPVCIYSTSPHSRQQLLFKSTITVFPLNKTCVTWTLNSIFLFVHSPQIYMFCLYSTLACKISDWLYYIIVSASVLVQQGTRGQFSGYSVVISHGRVAPLIYFFFLNRPEL